MSVKYVKCAYCREFVEADEAVRTGIQSYCNDEHRWAYANEGKQGSEKPKVGRSDDIPREVRERVLASDGHRCRFCGNKRPRGGLHLHHVVYRGQTKGWLEGTHVPHNLLTLCKEHHDTVHSDKKRWQESCLGVIWQRETTGDKQVLVTDFDRGRKWKSSRRTDR